MKIINYFIRQNSFKEYKGNIKDFGFIFTLKKFFYKNIMILSRYRLRFYQDFIYNFCLKLSEDIIGDIKEVNCEKKDNSNQIWVMWFQGVDNAPQLVKRCIHNQMQYAKSKEFDYIVLTEKNLKNYLDIPQFIINKLNENKITYTQFSDIVRVGILRKYGGIWMDSTILISSDLDKEFYELDFYTNKKNVYENMIKKNVSRGRWTGFFVKTQKNNVLFDFCWKFFINYWEKYDSLIDFYLIDYIFNIAYDKFEKVKKQIDTVPINNLKIYELNNILNDEFDHQKFNNILGQSHIFKLSYKAKLNETTPQGKKTNYGYLINNFEYK